MPSSGVRTTFLIRRRECGAAPRTHWPSRAVRSWSTGDLQTGQRAG